MTGGSHTSQTGSCFSGLGRLQAELLLVMRYFETCCGILIFILFKMTVYHTYKYYPFTQDQSGSYYATWA